MLWFDAEANFERFSKKENITYYLDLAKSTGFNKIVVDVRPVQGDALFKSSYLTPLTDLAGIHIERDWDYLQFLLMRPINVNLKLQYPPPYLQQACLLLKMGWHIVMIHGMENLSGIHQRSRVDRYKNDKTKVSAF